MREKDVSINKKRAIIVEEVLSKLHNVYPETSKVISKEFVDACSRENVPVNQVFLLWFYT